MSRSTKCASLVSDRGERDAVAVAQLLAITREVRAELTEATAFVLEGLHDVDEAHAVEIGLLAQDIVDDFGVLLDVGAAHDWLADKVDDGVARAQHFQPTFDAAAVFGAPIGVPIDRGRPPCAGRMIWRSESRTSARRCGRRRARSPRL